MTEQQAQDQCTSIVSNLIDTLITTYKTFNEVYLSGSVKTIKAVSKIEFKFKEGTIKDLKMGMYMYWEQYNRPIRITFGKGDDAKVVFFFRDNIAVEYKENLFCMESYDNLVNDSKDYLHKGVFMYFNTKFKDHFDFLNRLSRQYKIPNCYTTGISNLHNPYIHQKWDFRLSYDLQRNKHY